MIEFGYVLIMFFLWSVVFVLPYYRIAQTINALGYTIPLLLMEAGMVTSLTVNIVLMLNFVFLALMMIIGRTKQV